MLEHGGGLRAATRQHGIALQDWLDLSTGIAPYGWEIPSMPASVWRRLPEPGDGLEQAAQHYYGAAGVLPVAGSQAAIQALPRLRRHARVGIISPCYAEHAEAWRRQGHELIELEEGTAAAALERLDVLVVVNPNNPTGQLISTARLLQWHAALAVRGGWLVVDEAFIDCTPQHSLTAHSALPGLVVLRSFGKFFGLAGVRLGFVLAEDQLLRTLEALLGPWSVSGPTRWLGSLLLADTDGQQRQRTRLAHDGQRLATLLSEQGLPASGGCALFQTLRTTSAAALHEHLAGAGILTRLLRPDGLRFGLPGEECGWDRLAQALHQYRARAT